MEPLGGLRVLDLSRLLPGGYCTRLLAELGADVLKVEEPGRGDYVRSMPPLLPNGESAAHAWLNAGKRSVTVNLRSDAGRELLCVLSRRADVLVESFRPGVLDRLGVGYQRLREENPGLVYVGISGYGAAGPYTGMAGHDINYLAYAGALSFNGAAATGPLPPSLQPADLGGGAMAAVVAVLAALRVRDQTGHGQFCDVAMTDGVLSWLGAQAAGYAATGRVPRPGSAPLAGGLACYRVYACADGRHVAVGALEPRFFAVLLDGLGLGELIDWQYQSARQAELAERLAAALASRTRDEWVAQFADKDACLAPVLDLAEALADQSAAARGMVCDVAGVAPTRPWVSRVAPRLTRTPGRSLGPAPGLGADTDVVLGELGRSTDDIAALRAVGAV